MSDLLSLHEQLARTVLVGRELADVLGDVTAIARGAVPGVEAASITLIRGDRAYSAAYDGQLAKDVDEMQYDRGYGPCLEAGLGARTVVVSDVSTETRWPDYIEQAAARGVGSSVSLPLPFQSVTVGALNVYSRRPHGFAEEDVVLAEEVAAWTALAVGNADAAARTRDDLAHLRIAMQSRSVIEQAKGILMERYQLDQDHAFAVLSRVSQTSNTRLREVAAELVRTRVLPGG
ncbi:ANTAR domain-containing protein [Auraticoccus sp. F435]|uniref:ANTAR domain-containing protein n=1 Tax=Auraticoccus cholistanensis TaxID=2656650 RepID=A0A6A9URN8_9ACTN|nr:GAF and ANTAR domain-containing protein [Auraticoccus cholistanensis]MVA75423.1 ANTAR domain-containing protein [Auraticoccus cholistanensis]